MNGAPGGTGTPVTARDLLALPLPGRVQTLGGAGGLDRVLDRVVPLGADPGSRADSDPAWSRAAVMADLSARPDLRHGHVVDLLLRMCHHRGAHALIVVGETAPALVTRRLADRYRIALLAVTGAAAATVIGEVTVAVHHPQVATARLLVDLARELTRCSGDLERISAVVARALDASFAVHALDGTITGTSPLPRVPAGVVARFRSPAAELVEGRNVVVQPVSVPVGTPQTWLVAERDDAGPQWRDMASRALALAQGEVSAWATARRLRLAEEDRTHGWLLTELVEGGGRIGERWRERAAALGWLVDGRHVGVQIQPVDEGPLEAPALAALEDRLRAAGLDLTGPIGWRGGAAAWFSGAGPSGPAPHADLRDRLAGALAAFSASPAGRPVVAGVGRPSSGPEGIAATLESARAAALRALTRGGTGTVAADSGGGPGRLLVDWYSSADFRGEAARLLRPLAETDDALVPTLAAYFDAAASVTAAARALGVHRNTVMHRLRRIEDLLHVDLSDPDTRLALHLAVRVFPRPFAGQEFVAL
ncbi:helix-turn-helix domain-containing protein [Marinactinospora endophytica]